ncbi:MAG: hypothetical protein ACD_79C00975G0004, partial [uncultured bacterium]
MKNIRPLTRSKKGSALMTIFIFASIIVAILGAILKFHSQSHKMHQKSYDVNNALYLAESGIHLALDELNTQDPPFTAASDFAWNFNGTEYTLTRSDVGDISIFINYTDPSNVTIKSYGTYNGIRRGIETLSKKAPPGGANPTFPGAVASLSDITLMADCIVDSYADGNFDPIFYLPAPGGGPGATAWRPSYNGLVFSKGSDVTLASDVIVRGHVYGLAGTTFNVGPPAKGSIYWTQANEASLTCKTGEIKTFEDFRMPTVPPHLQMSNTPTVTITSGGSYGGGHYIGATNLNDFTFTGGFYKISGDIGIKNSKQWNITGNSDIYITGDITMGNGATIVNYTVSGGSVDHVYTLRIYAGGNVAFAQGAEVNIYSDYTPSKMQIYGLAPAAASSPSIDINNATAFYGTIYAPTYKINLNNGGQICGAFSVYMIDPKAKAEIHFDERLWG